MYTDLMLYSHDISLNDVQHGTFLAAQYNLNGVCVPSYFLHHAKDLITPGMILSTIIDFPYGMADSKVRSHGVLSAIKKGANAIDLVLPHYAIFNKSYKSLSRDLESNYLLCINNNVSLRVAMEYRRYTDKQLDGLCLLLKRLGVDYIFPSTGSFADDVVDNLITCVKMQEKYGIGFITNGNIWQQKHYDIIKDSKLFGCRLKSIKAAENIFGVYEGGMGS